MEPEEILGLYWAQRAMVTAGCFWPGVESCRNPHGSFQAGGLRCRDLRADPLARALAHFLCINDLINLTD